MEGEREEPTITKEENKVELEMPYYSTYEVKGISVFIFKIDIHVFRYNDWYDFIHFFI